MSEKTMAERRFPLVAMGFAVAALAIALIAVVVVIERGKQSDGTPTVQRTVAATDVVQLQGSGAKMLTDGGKANGLHVTDAELARKLGLANDDVITAISGRAIKREFDVHEAIFNTSMMKVTTLFVELERDGAPVLVRWKLDGDLQAARHASSPSLPPSSSLPPSPSFGIDPDATSDPLVDTIEKIDDTHVTIPRATVDAILGDPMKLARGARVIPAIKDGRPDGFKLYAIRPGSVYAKLGFNNGDTIQTINGLDVSSPDKALEVYTKVRSALEIVVEISRRGAPMTLTITIK